MTNCARWRASIWSVRRQPKSAGVPFATPYQAVLLTNGSVYFRQLEGYGTAMPVLKNAFYVVTRTDPKKKSVSNVLIKRGRMYLSPGGIVFVEKVRAPIRRWRSCLPNRKIAKSL